MSSSLRAARRRTATGAVTALLLTVVAFGFAPASANATAPTCQPGSGAHLAGQHVSEQAVHADGGLRCADLSHADLTGVDLTQVDMTGVLATGANLHGASMEQATLTGAVLTGADLGGANLTQATLTGAVFTNANLAHADLSQVEAGGVSFDGADLTDVNATQAQLQDASFAHAKLGGGDFTQAELGGVDFSGARGLTPWSLYVLLAAAAVFLIMAGFAVRRALRHRRPADGNATPVADPGAVPVWTGPAPYSGGVGLRKPVVAAATGAFNPINPPASTRRGVGASLAIGLLGALIVAFGAHLFLGGMVGTFSFAFDTLATPTCSAPQCSVGVDSGTLGTIGGVFVVLGGFFVYSRA